MRALSVRPAVTPAVALGLLLMLGGCGGSGSAPPSGPKTDVLRAESGCDVPGLAAPLRQTVVFLDSRAIKPSTDARDFAEKNSGLRDIVLSIADPARIQSSGLTAFRERVSIAVVPPDGSPAQLVFVGCPPGLSAGELADARRKSSAVGEFFTGDIAGKLADQGEAFSRSLIGALTAAGDKAAAGPVPDGPITNAAFLTGVKGSQALLDAKAHAPRLILVTDLSPLAPAGGFAEGLAAGRAAGGRFGLAEVHLVAPAGRPVAHKPFLEGWFLAQGADLASAGSGRVAMATPVPRRLWWFEGDAAYPKGAEPIALRLGDDGTGKLAAAWLTLRGTPDRSTPMTGTIACAAADHCEIRSDDGGFAQIWGGGSGGGATRFDSGWPFAGMRNFRATMAGPVLTGRVYDDGVYIGADQHRNGIDITGRARPL